MTSLTFDTHPFIRKRHQYGFSDLRAEALARARRAAEPVTRNDLQIERASARLDMQMRKWRLGLPPTSVLDPVHEAFLP
jgi:hypothetical protein